MLRENSFGICESKSIEEKRVDIAKEALSCGYDAEKHRVTTDDGYILCLHRIRSRNHINESGAGKEYPVFLQHGLLTDANFWAINGCEQSLPFILAREGYDVWLGNSRGTLYSEAHTAYDISSPRYWDFSFDEMAEQDIPTSISYVLKSTSMPKLKYVCHSQGCAILLSAVSENQGLNSLVERVVALGPAGRVKHIKGLLRWMSILTPSERVLTKVFGEKDFVKTLNSNTSFNKYTCLLLPDHLCEKTLFSIVGYNPQEMTNEIAMRIVSNLPSGTSVKNIVHYYQMFKSGRFCKFGHNSGTNNSRYNSNEPPEYVVSRTTVPIFLHSGTGDWLTSPEDVSWIANQLPDLRYHKKYENFAHLDYILGKSAPSVVFPEILKNIRCSILTKQIHV